MPDFLFDPDFWGLMAFILCALLFEQAGKMATNTMAVWRKKWERERKHLGQKARAYAKKTMRRQ